ncbi:F-box protein [Rickettsia endosymbiont of Halotydeus destructor]|uniref:F-box protein n=1 Tax=Rickettsia endosymbiont of Halotydeus destructor TaxID=2996754 RepID=UPI003BB00555
MPKLIVKENALSPHVILSTNNAQLNLAGPSIAMINIPVSALYIINGITDVEVFDNCDLIIDSSELPLNNINIFQGTINLNNNYEGTVPVAISIEENSKFTQTGKDLPMSSVTISAQADFNFTHYGVDYNIHNSAPSLSSQSSANGANITLLPGTGAKIDIKNPHEKLSILKKLESTKLKLNDFKYCEKFLDLLSENNSLSEDITEINSYINRHYFELTGVVKQHSTIHLGQKKENALGVLPDEVLTHICSYLNLNDVVQSELAGEAPSFTGE